MEGQLGCGNKGVSAEKRNPEVQVFPKAASWGLQTPQCSTSQPKRAGSAVGTRHSQPHRARLVAPPFEGRGQAEPCAVSGRGCLEAGVGGLALEGGRGRAAGRRAREARARTRAGAGTAVARACSVGRCSGCDGAGHGRGRWAGVALSPEGSRRLGVGHAGAGAGRARLRELLTALRDREPVAARGAGERGRRRGLRRWRLGRALPAGLGRGRAGSEVRGARPRAADTEQRRAPSGRPQRSRVRNGPASVGADAGRLQTLRCLGSAFAAQFQALRFRTGQSPGAAANATRAALAEIP